MSNFENSILALSNSLGFTIEKVKDEEFHYGENKHMYIIIQNEQTLLSSVSVREVNDYGILGSAWLSEGRIIRYVEDLEVFTFLEVAFKFAIRNLNLSLNYHNKKKLLSVPWVLIQDHLTRNESGSLEKLIEWLNKDSYEIPSGYDVVSRPIQKRENGVILYSAYGRLVTTNIEEDKEDISIDSSDEFVELDRPA